MEEKKSLLELAKGDKAIITSYKAEKIPLKLIEMGCVEGSEIELVQVAPLKDPLYLCVNGSYLAIRKEVAQFILIKILA